MSASARQRTTDEPDYPVRVPNADPQSAGWLPQVWVRPSDVVAVLSMERRARLAEELAS